MGVASIRDTPSAPDSVNDPGTFSLSPLMPLGASGRRALYVCMRVFMGM